MRTSSVHAKGKSHTKSNVEKIGGGTTAGAVIGAIAGDGKGARLSASWRAAQPEPEWLP